MGSLDDLTSSEKGEFMDQVKQQLVVASVQQLISKMTEKCFKTCVQKPGNTLDSSQQKCIGMCMDRYMDSFNLISRTYTRRLSQSQE